MIVLTTVSIAVRQPITELGDACVNAGLVADRNSAASVVEIKIGSFGQVSGLQLHSDSGTQDNYAQKIKYVTYFDQWAALTQSWSKHHNRKIARFGSRNDRPYSVGYAVRNTS